MTSDSADRDLKSLETAILLLLACGVLAASDPDRVRLAVDDAWFGPIYVVSEIPSTEGAQRIVIALSKNSYEPPANPQGQRIPVQISSRGHKLALYDSAGKVAEIPIPRRGTLVPWCENDLGLQYWLEFRVELSSSARTRTLTPNPELLQVAGIAVTTPIAAARSDKSGPRPTRGRVLWRTRVSSERIASISTSPSAAGCGDDLEGPTAFSLNFGADVVALNCCGP